MYPLPENRTFKRSRMSTNISFFCLPPDCAVDHVKYKREVSIWVLCASKWEQCVSLLSSPDIVIGLCTAVEGVVLELILGMRKFDLADSTTIGSL